MQTHIITILLIIFRFGQLTGQHIEISPENPSANDCIYIYTEAITNNLAFLRSFQLEEEDNNVTIESCYKEGPLNAIGYYYDTIALGYKNEGVYHLNYLLSVIRQGDSCDEAEQISTKLTFEVKENSLSESSCNELEVEVFPNPVFDSDLFSIIASESITQIDIFDASGKLIKQINRGGNKYINYGSTLFPASGVYFVRINGRSHNTITKRVIKY